MTGKITRAESELKAKVGGIAKGSMCGQCAGAIGDCALQANSLTSSPASEQAFHDLIQKGSVWELLARCPNDAIVAVYEESGLLT